LSRCQEVEPLLVDDHVIGTLSGGIDVDLHPLILPVYSLSRGPQ
jgi:hypothetical protein